MDSRTPAPWRRRALAATGVIGIAVAGGGFLVPGVAAAATPAQTHFTWTFGSDPQWPVPAGVCFVDWKLLGGSGGHGANTGGAGGLGGHVTSRMPVTAGDSIVVQVGGAGQDAVDGGAGGLSDGQPSGGTSNETLGGGGGGASVVSLAGEPLLVAGGGGGGGNDDDAAAADGGAAGGGTGGAGQDGTAGTGGAAGGLGGVNPADGVPASMVGVVAESGAGAGGGGYDAGAPGSVGGAIDSDDQPIGGGGGGGANYVAPAAEDGIVAVVNGKAEVAGNGSVEADLVPCSPAEPVLDTPTTTPGEVTVVFAPGATNGAAVTGYEVSTDDGTTWAPLSDTTTAEDGTVSATLTEPEGAELTVKVRATTLYDGSATFTHAPASAGQTVTVASTAALPAAPTFDSAASTVTGQIDFSFTPHNNGVEVLGYEVSTDGTNFQELETAPGSGAMLLGSVSGLTPGDQYAVYVRASYQGKDEAPFGKSDLVTVAQLPDAPALDQPTSTTPGSVDVVFTPGATNGATVTGYQVSTDGGTTWGATRTPSASGGSKEHVTLTGQTEGATLQVSVRAVTAGGQGPASAPQTVTVASTTPVVTPPQPPTPTPVPDTGGTPPTAATPHAPAGVTAQAGASQVTVSWSAPVGGGAVDHYQVTLAPGGQTCTTKALSCVLGASAGVDYTATVVAISADGVAGPGAAASLQGAVAAPAVPAQVPATALTLTTDKGDLSSATPGQQITVLGTGFLPYSTVNVVIYSDPVVLGAVVTDGEGNFSQQVTVPADLPVGEHHLVASGVAPDGSQRFLRMDVTVAAATAAAPAEDRAGQLAWTGFEALTWVLGGMGAIAVGGIALLVSRRRAGAQL